jgi:hypothetical protein
MLLVLYYISISSYGVYMYVCRIELYIYINFNFNINININIYINIYITIDVDIDTDTDAPYCILVRILNFFRAFDKRSRHCKAMQCNATALTLTLYSIRKERIWDVALAEGSSHHRCREYIHSCILIVMQHRPPTPRSRPLCVWGPNRYPRPSILPGLRDKMFVRFAKRQQDLRALIQPPCVRCRRPSEGDPSKSQGHSIIQPVKTQQCCTTRLAKL